MLRMWKAVLWPAVLRRYHRACFAPGGSVVCGFAAMSEYAPISHRVDTGSP
jgi:hypothetical protein